MAADERLIEIMADLLAEARENKAITLRMAEGIGEMRADIGEMRADIGEMRADVGELKTHMAKNNAAIGELRLSVMRLADRIEEIHELDKRVRVLENIVLPKSPLQAAGSGLKWDVSDCVAAEPLWKKHLQNSLETLFES